MTVEGQDAQSLDFRWRHISVLWFRRAHWFAGDHGEGFKVHRIYHNWTLISILHVELSSSCKLYRLECFAPKCLASAHEIPDPLEIVLLPQ